MLKSSSGLYIPTLQEGSDFERDLSQPYFLGERLTREEVESCMSIGLRLMVHDGNKLELDVPGHSIVQQWPTFLATSLGVSSVQTVKDTGGTLRTLSTTDGDTGPAMTGAVNSALKGIVCGTGGTAVAITDYVLETAIVNGVGAGQLQWAADQFAALSTSGTSRLITITRAFTNNSAGSITVNEVALYGQMDDSGATERTFCFCRDLLSFEIGIGQTKTVTYQFTIALT